MRIILNYANDSYVYNLAFVKALLIKKTIDNLSLDYNKKKEIKKQVLEYLQIQNGVQNEEKNKDSDLF